MRNKTFAVLLGVLISLPLGIWAQDWYEATGKPVQRGAVNSADLRTEFASIESDIADKLPALTGNGGKLIVVNAGGTALEASSTGLTVAQGGTGAATLTGILQGNGTSAFTGLTSSTVGQTLRVTAANTYGWGALDLADTDAITGDLPDGNLSANVPLLNGTANVFTGVGSLGSAAIYFNNVLPRLAFDESDAAADNQVWYIDANTEQFGISAVNDALSATTDALSIDRTGQTIDEIELNATTLDFNGSMDVSGSAVFNNTTTVNATTFAVSAAGPQMRWRQTGAAADNQYWIGLVNSEQWSLRAYEDDLTTQSSAIAIERTGSTIDEIDLNATTLDFNGDVDISGSLVLGTDLAVAQGGTGASTLTGLLQGNGTGAITGGATVNDSNWSGTDLALANGGTGASLVDPDADRIVFWDDSAGATTFLTVGTGLTITGTTIETAAGGGTVTQVDGAGTENGLTLTGSVTTTGSLTLGGTLAISNADWSGTDLSVANGGTGASTLTGLLQGNGVGAFTGIANSSTVGQVLRTTGASTYAWGALDLADGDAVTGDLPDANLSANLTAIAGLAVTDSNIIVGNGTTWVAESGATARTSLGLGALATLATINNTALIDNEIVTNAKLADMAVNTIKGRVTAGTGDAEDLTATQALNVLETADGAGSGFDADLLDGESGTFYQRNITGKAGGTKTLLANASCPPAGGSDGDIWYCY